MVICDRHIKVLLIEGEAGDARLIREALRRSTAAKRGEDACHPAGSGKRSNYRHGHRPAPAPRHADQKGIKRVVAEMGGKNAIFVDTDCDLDDAVAGVLHSAFGYQGQKCSAASRLILLSDNYDEVLKGLVKKAEALTIGPARENCQLNAVINENSFNKINYYIEQGKREGRLITGGETFSER